MMYLTANGFFQRRFDTSQDKPSGKVDAGR